MTRRRDLIDDIFELMELVRRDDPQTRATLALMRNGHPRATATDRTYAFNNEAGEHWDPEDGAVPGLGHSDPVGENAIKYDKGAQLLRDRKHHLERAYYHICRLDDIRRFALPNVREARTQSDPDDWCKNCYQYGYCAPRNNDRDHYCRYCRTTQGSKEWGFLPPKAAVEHHHNGDHAKATAALMSHKRARR